MSRRCNFLTHRSIFLCAPLRQCPGYQSTALNMQESYSGPKKSHSEVKWNSIVVHELCLAAVTTAAVLSFRYQLRWRQSRAHPVGVWKGSRASLRVQHHWSDLPTHPRWAQGPSSVHCPIAGLCVTLYTYCVLGVVKRIIPAVASTNAVIAGKKWFCLFVSGWSWEMPSSWTVCRCGLMLCLCLRSCLRHRSL